MVGKSKGHEIELKAAAKVLEQAKNRCSLGKYQEAEDLYLQGLNVKSRILGEYHIETCIINTDIADMWMTLHQFGKAEPYYVAAKSIITECVHKAPSDTQLQQQHRKVLRDLAFLYYLQGSVLRKSPQQKEKWELAEKYFKEVIKMTEEQLGRRSHELAEPLRNLASLYVRIGMFQESELIFKRCIGIQLVNCGMDDPTVLATRQQLAILHERRDQRRCQEAAIKVQSAWRGYQARQKRQEYERQGKLGKSSPAASLPTDGTVQSTTAPTADRTTAPTAASSPLSQKGVGYFIPGAEGLGDWDPDKEEDNASSPLNGSLVVGKGAASSGSPSRAMSPKLQTTAPDMVKPWSFSTSDLEEPELTEEEKELLSYFPMVAPGR